MTPHPKLGAKRVKATRACDRCKKKKSKCSGEQPCNRCNDDSTDCAYTSQYTRGREPIIPPRSNIFALELPQRNVQSEIDNTDVQSVTFSNFPEDPPDEHAELDSQEFNSSNGRSIFDRTQNNLCLKASRHQKSSIFMFGDPPLPEFDGSFFFLPPAETARTMVGKYFDNIAATLRFLHRPTVDKWMESYSTNFMGEENGQRNIRAILLLILASAHRHMAAAAGEETLDPSIRYFQAAEYQLQKETGQIQLASIQARLLQCFYLQSRSRKNQGWSTFGTVVNLIVAFGIHRKQKYDIGEEMDVVEMECRRRTFWSAYTLDKYLSCTLGRPQMFHDEDIDQDLPSAVSDDDLEIASITMTRGKPEPSMQATICQIELSKVMGRLLKDLHGLHPLATETRLTLTEKHQIKLEQWRKEVVQSLGFGFPSAHLSIPTGLSLRDNIALMLTYFHVMILLYRPFLVDAFSDVPTQRERMKANVHACLDASMQIIEIVNGLYERDRSFDTLWFAHYCGYSATICLYMYVIRAYEQTPETWTKYLHAAQKCQQQIDICAESESFARRCSQVLKEVERETLDCIRRKEVSSQALVSGSLGGTWSLKESTVIERIDRYGFSSLAGY